MTTVQDIPNWARNIVERELRDVELSSFNVLKETPLDKIAVGYTPGETYLFHKSLTHEEVFRIERPSDVHGEEGERMTCGHCGAVFRVWRGENAGSVHCFECGRQVHAHTDPVGRMTPYEDTLERPRSGAHGVWPGVTPGALESATGLDRGAQGRPLGRAPDLENVPRAGTDLHREASDRHPTDVPRAHTPPPTERELEAEARELSHYPQGAPPEGRGIAGRPGGPVTAEDTGPTGVATPYFPGGGESAYAPDVAAPFRGRGPSGARPEPAPPAPASGEAPHPMLSRRDPRAPLREAASGHPAGSAEGSELLEIEGIGPVILRRLEAIGVHHYRSLEEADPQDVAKACGVPLATAKIWQAQGELLRLHSVGPLEANTLVQNGIDGVKDLARRKPEALAQLLRSRGVPVSSATVERWIREAQYRGRYPGPQ